MKMKPWDCISIYSDARGPEPPLPLCLYLLLYALHLLIISSVRSILALTT